MPRIYLTFITILFIAQSCIVPQFAEPQPSGLKIKPYFPEKLRGRYQVRLLNVTPKANNQSTMLIDSLSLNLYEVTKVSEPLSEIKADSSIRLIDGYIYLQEKSGTTVNPYVLLNDTVYYTDSNTVSLSLTGNCILKEWKGHYFINHKREKYWDVLLMDQQKENVYTIQALVLSEKVENDGQIFSDPSEIPIDSFYFRKKTPAPVKANPKKEKSEELYLENLERISNVRKESTDYIIKPSRRQLKKLIRKKFFKEVWRIEKSN